LGFCFPYNSWQDVIELREREWVSRNAVAVPTTIAQIHDGAPLCSSNIFPLFTCPFQAAKEKAAHEKEASQRQVNMSRGGDRGDFSQQSNDGWGVTSSES